jgi:tRNA threonylcarbamoyl adenosine modification protein YjeE
MSCAAAHVALRLESGEGDARHDGGRRDQRDGCGARDAHERERRAHPCAWPCARRTGAGVAATINSPTFTILKEYEGRLPLYHFDFYRLDEPDELYELGFEDYFRGGGVCVVEWAERGEFKDDEEPVWDGDWLRVALSITGEDERTLACTAEGARGQELLAAFLSVTRSGD